jgi:Icc-related predicted phosphoesterase
VSARLLWSAYSGTDDRHRSPELAGMLDRAPWGVHAEGKVVQLDDEHQMICWGYANTTPWHTYREQNEQQLAAAYAAGSSRTPP